MASNLIEVSFCIYFDCRCSSFIHVYIQLTFFRQYLFLLSRAQPLTGNHLIKNHGQLTISALSPAFLSS